MSDPIASDLKAKSSRLMLQTAARQTGQPGTAALYLDTGDRFELGSELGDGALGIVEDRRGGRHPSATGRNRATNWLTCVHARVYIVSLGRSPWGKEGRPHL